MHELGNVQHTANPWSVFNPWNSQKNQSTSESSDESARFHVSGDAAVTDNPWAVFNPWDTQENQSAVEIYMSTLKQMKAEADKALRCQENLGAQRVLGLL